MWEYLSVLVVALPRAPVLRLRLNLIFGASAPADILSDPYALSSSGSGLQVETRAGI